VNVRRVLIAIICVTLPLMGCQTMRPIELTTSEPLIAVASRLIQGLALGVEVGASTAVPLECVPAGRGAVYTSWQGAPPIPPWWVLLTSLQEVKAEL